MSVRVARYRSLLRAAPPAVQMVGLLSDMEETQYRTFPHFTSKGYRVARLPRSLRRRLTASWERHRSRRQPENIDTRYFRVPNGADILPLQEHDPELLREVEEFVRAELERWTGMRDLRHTMSYGIREYKDGAVMHSHVDRYDTHVLSAIVHVGSRGVRKPWELQVQNRAMAEPAALVFSDDVDVILYESASLAHGRTQPLEGGCFANLFIHMAPRDWGERLESMGLKS